MTFKRSLGFQGELVSTRAPRALILSVTPPWDGVRISRLHRSTRTFICVRSSARLLFAAVSIRRMKPFWLGGNRYTQSLGEREAGTRIILLGSAEVSSFVSRLVPMSDSAH